MIRTSTAATRILACAVILLYLVVAPVAAQAPTFQRGQGELLRRELRPVPSPLSDMADLTMPEYLWAFQREALAPVGAPPALPAADHARVVTALLSASRDVDATLRWQSLWALARIARGDAAIAKQLHARVGDRVAPGGLVLEQDGAVGDVGCLTVGLASCGDQGVLTALAAIANNEKLGARRRAYAFYGLGLAAQESGKPDMQFRVLAAVEHALLNATKTPDEVRIAALHALALLRVDAAPDLPGPVDQLLKRAWTDSGEPKEGLLDVRAHVPFAVAAVCKPGSERARVWCERLGEAAEGRGHDPSVQRSCVLALGRLAGPWQDESSLGAATGELLQRLAQSARDRQLMNYALFAMGEAGGPRHVRALEKALDGNFLVRPWAAFGLAVSARGDKAAGAERAKLIEAAVLRTRHPTMRAAMKEALAVAERAGELVVADPAESFMLRYGEPLAADGPRELAARLVDGEQSTDARCAAAVTLGHLADRGDAHWSARLASAIDYRNVTPALLGFWHGVLRLP